MDRPDWWNEPEPIDLVASTAKVLTGVGMDPWQAMRLGARVWEKVDRVLDDTSCWLWNSATMSNGYPQLQLDGRSRAAHRLILSWCDRPPRDDENACHVCDVRLCCRPDHMWWGSHAENMLDMRMKGRMSGPAAANAVKTHCAHGHPLSGENLGVNNRGQRFCRECARGARKRSYRKKGL